MQGAGSVIVKEGGHYSVGRLLLVTYVSFCK